METPTPSSSSSSRRITGSQALTMGANNNIPFFSRGIEGSEKDIMRSRAALIDITNDSPIVGLAIGSMKTPTSTFCKKRMIVRDDGSKEDGTPGSGEALLRDQVQTLLQKVEEEAVIKKITFGPLNFVNSPMNLVAPTPANTPQLSENNTNGSESLTVSPVVSESFNFSQISSVQMLDQQEETEETLEKNVITKLLFTDFPEKLEGYDSCLDEDDDASVWSIQVNASISDEHEDDEEFQVDYEDGVMDELCEVMFKISANDGDQFRGKQKRFVCDNNRELEGDA